jgi:hypothetical protein
LIFFIGLGTGLDIAVRENLDFVGEYFPVTGGKDSVAFGGGPVMANCYSVGFKISTPGHHFMFSVSQHGHGSAASHARNIQQ